MVLLQFSEGFPGLRESPFEGGSPTPGYPASPWGQQFWGQGFGHFGGVLAVPVVLPGYFVWPTPSQASLLALAHHSALC